MSFKRIVLVVFLGSIGTQAFAASAEAQKLPVETYSYGTQLDIQHVVSVTEPANECAPAPVQMTYEDSHGERHVLQYQVMSSGCSNS